MSKLDSSQISDLVDYVTEECNDDTESMRAVADAIKVEADAIDDLAE